MLIRVCLRTVHVVNSEKALVVFLEKDETAMISFVPLFPRS